MQAGGVEKILPIGQIDDQEKELLAAAVKELGPSIEKVSCRDRSSGRKLTQREPRSSPPRPSSR